jgi:ABC transporter substrate binding protein
VVAHATDALPACASAVGDPLERSFAGKHAAGDGDILATGLLGQVDSLPQGTVLAHLRQLDQHGKIHSCEHVHIWTVHAGNSQVGRRAGAYAARIIQGAKPGDLPIEQASKFTLVLNLKTAKQLGISVQPTLLSLADEVIE